MLLRRIEIFGFKSFADRTEIVLEPGLTGLVGPNGCGKSNVVEAIRWVLGEQRPSALRGDEMSDVIFKGTASRPGLGVAEVSLVLEDGRGTLPEGRPEVSLTRRLFRTGESEYLLDGRACRLRDLRDFLFDAGVNIQACTMMEQGRIDAILADARSRRAVLEEAAGVAKFRTRRRETMRKLEQVEADLARLGDVLVELERRTRSLRVQAGRARRYEELVRTLREDRVAQALHLRWGSGEEVARLGADLAALEGRERELQDARRSAEEAVRSGEDVVRALEAERERLAAEASARRDEERSAVERARALRERAADLERDAARGDERLAELEPRIAARETACLELEEARNRLAGEREGADLALAAADGAVLARQAELRGIEDETAEVRTRLLEAVHARTEAGNRRLAAEAERRGVAARLDRAASRETEIRGSRTALEGERQERAEALRNAEGRATASDRALEEARARLAHLERAHAEVDARSRALEGDRSALASRREVLRALDESGEGIGRATKALLAKGLPGLEGLLADRVRPSSRLAAVLEAALGPYAASLLAPRAAIAIDAIERARAEEEGRVLLGVAELAPRRAEAPAVLRGEGIEGRLVDLLAPEASIRPLLEAAIGDVFLVADLATASRLAGEHPHLRFATPRGEIAGRGFVLGGRPEAAEAGPLGRAALRRELEPRLAEVERDLDRTRSRAAALAEEIEGTKRALAAAEGAAAAAHREAAAAALRLEETDRRLSELEEALEDARLEAGEARRDIERLLDAEAQAVRDLAGRDEAIARLEARLRDLEEGRAGSEAAREAAAREASEARVAATRIAEQCRSAEARSSAEAEAIADDRRERERLRADLAGARAAMDAARREAAALDASARNALEARGALDAKEAEVRRRGEATRTRFGDERNRLEACLRELEGLQRSLGEARLAEQRLVLQREESVRRLREDYGVDLDALAEGFSPDPAFDAAAAETRIQEVRGQLDRFGPVNLEAIAELREVEERSGFLGAQRGDLEEARTSLREALRALDTECRERFEETFTAVREHFRTVFRQLFRGGKADLEIEEGVDPLEAGIEIAARPPGKELRSIELLSGGERTLTALALLFAIFRTKPSPFCLLDEVDAALDDANVERFLGLLRDSLAEAQFVLVTHNRRSMAACASLYGITMEESGVSKRVAVRLDEAEAFALPAAEEAEEAPRAPSEPAPVSPG